MDAHFRSFEKLVLPVALSKNMGVLGMKSVGAGIILESKVVSAVDCLRYALTLPTSVVITACDSTGVLDQAIDVALKFKTSERFDGTTQHLKWLTTAEI